MLRQAMQEATVIVAPVHELDDFGLEELAGKTIITSTVNDARIAQFRDKGVHMVIDGAPVAVRPRAGPEPAGRDDHRRDREGPGGHPRGRLPGDHHRASQLEPRIIYPNGFKRVNRFAFVIHPLSQEYFKNVKPIELLSHVSPPRVHGRAGEGDGLRAALRLLAGHGHQVAHRRGGRGLAHLRGRHAEGDHEPQPRVHLPPPARRGARWPSSLGAQIMGLGAFTKVVGDAGLTVARRAPLPITTGNSYSASGALWAAHDALLRLGLRARAEARARR